MYRRLADPRVRYGLVLLWAVLVLAASVVDPPSGSAPASPPALGVPLDKLLHAATYGVLAGLLAHATLARTPRSVAVVALVATAYGFGIEGVQATLPARSFELADAVANALGATLAAGLWGAGLVVAGGSGARAEE